MSEPGRLCEVMLDDEHGVAQVHDSTQHLDQAGGVDGRRTGDDDAPLPSGRRVPRQCGQVFLHQWLLGLFAVGDVVDALGAAPHHGGDHALAASTGHGGQTGKRADRAGGHGR
ncbi:hypothetical protein [Streptomyces sp. NRRL S-1813]|uniref:hypothetical protein n=1 Tax=Streptomyces sp. NRRL S-1813 TaxID=1463888 RepID=UPI0004C84DF5|nr:hypothetical protein [Streptomyces sp. NRRL S-1813]